MAVPEPSEDSARATFPVTVELVMEWGPAPESPTPPTLAVATFDPWAVAWTVLRLMVDATTVELENAASPPWMAWAPLLSALAVTWLPSIVDLTIVSEPLAARPPGPAIAPVPPWADTREFEMVEKRIVRGPPLPIPPSRALAPALAVADTRDPMMRVLVIVVPVSPTRLSPPAVAVAVALFAVVAAIATFPASVDAEMVPLSNVPINPPATTDAPAPELEALVTLPLTVESRMTRRWVETSSPAPSETAEPVATAVAELVSMWEDVTVIAVSPRARRPPPSACAKLPVDLATARLRATVEPRSVRRPPCCMIPPPLTDTPAELEIVARFPTTLDAVRVSEPPLEKIPPPTANAPVATLFSTVTLLRVSTPPFMSMPAPRGDNPPVIVRPTRCTVWGLPISRVVAASLPSRVAVGFPFSVRSLTTMKCPMQVPLTSSVDPPGARSIFVWRFAAEQSTLMVAARAGGPRATAGARIVQTKAKIATRRRTLRGVVRRSLMTPSRIATNDEAPCGGSFLGGWPVGAAPRMPARRVTARVRRRSHDPIVLTRGWSGIVVRRQIRMSGRR